MCILAKYGVLQAILPNVESGKHFCKMLNLANLLAKCQHLAGIPHFAIRFCQLWIHKMRRSRRSSRHTSYYFFDVWCAAAVILQSNNGREFFNCVISELSTYCGQVLGSLRVVHDTLRVKELSKG